jgi:antitoxin component of RelBE/YafQ-DinJ toxin-antitoxin module
VKKMARNAKLIIMTDERVKERLQFYADQLGMTMSGLGAYILGYWVYQQDKMVNPLIERVKDVVVQIAREEMNSMDELEQPSEA